MKLHSASAFGVLALMSIAGCSEAFDFDEPEPTALANLSQALSDPAVVFGFENIADWTVTQGVKVSSSDHSQGAASLGVSNFTFTTITSTPLSTVPGVTDTLALDVKVPAAPAWGELSIFISIPSKNVFEAKIGQVTIAGLSTGTFHPLSFAVPENLRSVLASSYDDLRVKVTLNAPQTSQSYLLDNLHFVGLTALSKVEIEMTQPIDDFFYASVDGLRQKIWFIGDPEQNGRLNATAWFGAGNHALRLQAINTGGPATYGVRVWVDDVVVLDEQCPASICNGQNTQEGILLDRTLNIDTPTQPASQLVRVMSATPGKLYLDDGFTGITTTGTSPVIVSLPPGQYTLGLGVSDDSPPVYSGSFREQSITVNDAAVDVSFNSSTPLGIQDATRIAVVPVRTLVVDPFNQSAVLAQADLDDLEIQLAATRDEWLEPFSYGLMTWDLDILPVVENVPLHAPNPHDPPNADQFLIDAALTGLRQSHELVLLFYNCFDANGNVLRGSFNGEVVDFNASAWGGGGTVWINPLWTGLWEPDGPNPALLHEALHNYEQYNQFNLHFYNGVQGMHGDNEHGYYSSDNGELDFALYQRLYVRGQVAELSSMRAEVPVAAPPNRADLWVGVFDTIRRGYDPNGPAGFAAVSTAPDDARFVPLPRGR